ncbi:MAG: Rv2175c family DNA-binding protein [Jatrophihabitans sp.]
MNDHEVDPHQKWLTLEQAADQLGVKLQRMEQYLRDGQMVARRGTDGVVVPALSVGETGPVKGLPGVITLLRDARFSDEEIIDWLLRADDSIPGTPLAALAENRGTEIKRRAQVAGY